MRTNVEVAERWGLIHRDPTGRWVDSKPADQQGAAVQAKVAEEQQPQQQEGAASFFDRQTDGQIGEAIADSPQHAYDGAIARLVGWMAHGTNSEEAIATQLARDVPGMEAHVALRHVQGFQRAHEAALEKALAPMGLTGDRANAFIADLKSSPAKFQEAVHGCSTSAARRASWLPLATGCGAIPALRPYSSRPQGGTRPPTQPQARPS